MLKKHLGLLVFILIAISLILLHVSVINKNLSDPDGFYHAKMADLVVRGEVNNHFKWLPYTTWNQDFADQHLLYHWLLYLFPGDLKLSLSVAVFGIIFIAAFWILLKAASIERRAFWIILLLVGSSDFLFRMNLVKANTLSLALLAGIMIALIKKKYWLLLPLSFIFVWSYGGFVLLPLVVGGYSLSFIIIKLSSWKRSEASENLKSSSRWNDVWKSIFLPFIFLAIGIGLGLVLHPQFPHIFKHLYIQIFEVMRSVKQGVYIGGEWYPYDLENFFSVNGLAFVVWFVSILILIFGKRLSAPERQRAIWFSLISVATGLLMVSSKRFVEYWVPFAGLSAAAVLDPYVRAIDWSVYKKQAQLHWQVGVATIILIAALGGFGFYNLKAAWGYFQNGASYELYRPAADSIRQNASPEDIVFNTQWDQFPALFYWNDKNNYIIGMDPTFMYVQNKELYWKWRKISEDDPNVWPGDYVHESLVNDFHAKFVFIENNRNPKLKEYMENPFHYDEFQKLYADEETSVYTVN